MNNSSALKYDLSVILPTYNEKENIIIILDKIRKVLKNESYQIIVVDDNSPDGTWEIAQQYAKKLSNIQVIRRLNTKGLSSAISEGFGSSNSKWMVVMDADLQHDEKILVEFARSFEQGYDIVVGSRKTAGGSIGEWNFLRRVISWIATKMAFFIIKNNVSDPMSGFFGIRKEVFENSIDKINPRGFKLLLELLAHNPNAKTHEIGFTFNKRQYGKSKLNTNVIVDYMEAMYDLSFGKYLPLRFVKYSIIGLIGLFVYQVSIWVGLNLLGISKYYSLALGIEAAILSNYFFNNFWTFRDYRHKSIHIVSGLFSYHLISLAGVVINYSSTVLLMSQYAINIYMASIIGAVLSTLWNYRMNFQITWKKEI
jgi:dolichol-phosphate mannosyltransferase